MALNSIGYAAVLMEEICLEGLDGITPETLWMRLSVKFKHDLLPNFKKKLWNMILQLKFVRFYLLPKPRPTVNSYDRFSNVDPRGNFIPVETDAHIYGYYPVKDENGSCQFYNTREDISTEVNNTSYEDVWEKWHNMLVIVGDKSHRWNTLAPGIPYSVCETLTPTLYCLLEMIGRSRHNGELTYGVNSLTMIEKEAKKLNYYHNQLVSQDLILKQHVSIRIKNVSTTCVLLHLSRFFHEAIHSLGFVIRAVEKILKTSPERTVVLCKVKEELQLDDATIKKFKCSSETLRKIKIERIPCDHIVPDSTNTKSKTCTLPDSSHIILKLIDDCRDHNDESEFLKSHDSDKPIGSAVMRKGLLRQVYNCICNSKSTGISIKGVSKALGIDSATMKMAMKYLKLHDLLNVSYIDHKKQRISKYSSKEFQCESKMKHKEDDVFMNFNACFSKFIPSSKKIQRANLIMMFLAENHITSNISDIRRFISKYELNNDSGMIDNASIKRLISQMEKEDKLKNMRVKVTVETFTTILNFVCEKSIDIHHIYVKNKIEQTKYQLMLKISRSSIDNHHVSQTWANRKQKCIENPYPVLQKFARLRIFHEFLFYLTYCHENKVCELPENIKKCLTSEKTFLGPLPIAYESKLKNGLFVSPVDQALPRGWILLSDAIDRIPLCLFSNLISTNSNIPGIMKYLKDSIKCQIPIKSLPVSIQYYLMFKGRYRFILYGYVEQLCLMGLVQFGHQVMKEKDKIYIYLNKNSILWNTISSKPGYHKIEDKEYPRESIEFENISDIENYWNRMFIICTETKLGQRYAALGDEVECVSPEVKMAYALKKRSFEEAVEADCGYIPGDGLGAAGFDSMLFSHLKRSWHRSLIFPIKNHEKIANMRQKHVTSRGDKNFQISSVKNKKKVVRTLKPRKSVQIRSPKLDAVDKNIIQKYCTKRATWKNNEDQLLFIFKIAFHIIYPPRSSMNFHIIRDFMLKTVSPPYKTSMTFRRRMIFLMQKSQNFHQVEIYLTEFRRDEEINKNFSNLYNRLKNESFKNKSILELDNYCRIRLVELVNMLYKTFIKKNVQNQVLIILPKTLNKLHEEYDIETPSLYSVKIPESIIDKRLEIKVNVLKSLIHSALSCSIGKETSVFSLFDTYKDFPEGMLRSTINSLRSTSMISMQRLEIRKEDGKIKYTKYSKTTSHYKLSQAYFIQTLTKLPSTLYLQVYKYINMLKSESKTEDSIYSLTGGRVAALFDLITMNLINIDLNTSSCSNGTSTRNELLRSKMLPCLESSSEKIRHTYVITGYSWNISILDSLRKRQICPPENIKVFFDEISSNSLVYSEAITNVNSNFQSASVQLMEHILNEVSDFISAKCEIGASQDELKEKFVISQIITLKELNEVLKELQNRNIVRRFGNITRQWVSHKYSTYWCVKSVPSTKKNENTLQSQNTNDDSVSLKSDVNSTIDEENPSYSTKRKISLSENDVINPSKRQCTNSSENIETENVDISHISKNTAEENNKNLNQQNEIAKTADAQNETEEIAGAHIGVDDLCDLRDKINTVFENYTYIFPYPWVRPDGTLNSSSFFQWGDAILSHLLLNPLIKLVALQERFNFLQFYEIQLLTEIMEKIGCVEIMHIYIKRKPGLFSKNTVIDLVTETSTGLENIDELYVKALDGAIIKFASFKGQILDSN